MSYILDALRKADAQRERDPARGIHAQGALQSSPTGTGGLRGPLLWGSVAAGVIVVAGAAWFMSRNKQPSVVVPAAVAPPPVVAVAPPAAAVAPAPPPVLIAPSAAPMAPIVGTPPAGRTIPPRDPTNTSQPTMRGAQPVPGMVPEVPPSARAADAREAAMMRSFGPGARSGNAVQTAPAVVAQANPAAPVAAPPAASAQPPVGNSPAATRGSQSPSGPPPGMAPRMAPPVATSAPAPIASGLPPDAPQLAVSGGVYSENAAQRMLIVNGQVFNEGSEIAAGVTLERVTPKGAVVKFRGANYNVAY